MKEQDRRRIALQASGEYLMNHLEGVMEMIEDRRALYHESELNEKTLTSIEAQIKALAEELIQQSTRGLSATQASSHPTHVDMKGGK